MYTYNKYASKILVHRYRIQEVEQSIGAIIKYQNNVQDNIATSYPHEFLLLKNRRGFWGFPQGHKEKGENEIQTLIREVTEETGIRRLDIRSYIGKIHYSYFRADGMKYEKEVSFYYATTHTKTVNISYEHDEFRWTPFSNALLMLHHGQLKFIMMKGHKKGLY
jgi:bis(5'-nucleosidyl)-tetraphosphatase